MTRILFLPDDQTMLWLESTLPAEELAASIDGGRWRLPEPYSLRPALEKSGLRAIRLGRLVVVMPAALPSGGEKKSEISGERKLSLRQRQVLQGLAEGLTTRQIAARLRLRPRTVIMHVAALKARFGAATRAESVGRAAALGLMADSEQGQADEG